MNSARATPWPKGPAQHPPSCVTTSAALNHLQGYTRPETPDFNACSVITFCWHEPNGALGLLSKDTTNYFWNIKPPTSNRKKPSPFSSSPKPHTNKQSWQWVQQKLSCSELGEWGAWTSAWIGIWAQTCYVNTAEEVFRRGQRKLGREFQCNPAGIMNLMKQTRPSKLSLHLLDMGCSFPLPSQLHC